MNNQKIISNLLSSIIELSNSLSEKELKMIESGDFDIILKKNHDKRLKVNKKNTSNLSQNKLSTVINDLDLVSSREEGLKIIEKEFSTKSQLEVFAKFIDVAIIKRDKIDIIKEKIVDATVGARLRSNAIQGKDT